MNFLIGLLLGVTVSAVAAWWFLERDGGDSKWIVEKWWAENEDRWMGLREQLLRENDDA